MLKYSERSVYLKRSLVHQRLYDEFLVELTALYYLTRFDRVVENVVQVQRSRKNRVGSIGLPSR